MRFALAPVMRFPTNGIRTCTRERQRSGKPLDFDPEASRIVNRKDGDFAQAPVKLYGKGRVFCCGFGHRTEIWWNPKVLKPYLDAIRFAAGDLDAPTVPRSWSVTAT